LLQLRSFPVNNVTSANGFCNNCHINLTDTEIFPVYAVIHSRDGAVNEATKNRDH